MALKRIRLLHEQTIGLKQQIEKLKKSAIAASKEGITVDEELHQDLKDISNDNIALINSMCPEGSFQRIFWDQQTEAASLNNSCSLHWHPLYIKWSLYLKHLSSKA